MATPIRESMARLFSSRGTWSMAKTKGSDEETLGQRLARLRKSRGITQVELAKLLGLGQSNVSDYERDVCRPNADMLIKIAESLSLSPDEILGFAPKGRVPEVISRRLIKRMIAIERLPKRDQQAIIRTIDAFLGRVR
jgi:transcriptional regulator with XRE-family HTH domain